MVKPDIEVLEINEDGTSTDITPDGEIKDVLNSDTVALIIDDRKKIIWIWKGLNARVRKKFIAARQAQEIKGNRGLTFKTKSIEHGDEPKKFLKLVGGKIPTDEGTSGIDEEINAKIEESQIIQPKYTDMRNPQAPNVNRPIKKEPKFQAAPPITQKTSTKPIISQPAISQPAISQPPPKKHVEEPDKSSEVLSEIESMPVPEGYRRELIIIGSQAYSLVEMRKTFMGEEKIEYKLDKTDTPDGDFLGVDYTPRTIVKNGKIIAVELLRSLEEKTPQKQDISDIKVKALKIKMHKK
ncbi:MAG: hypothetical protein EU549_01205 [Promethearchaeota archaeon]|nr:MAG: hypothetical protein EU549_01205 [Candidatus Lokiarchaeota archaeon]